jgi:hypothetical protein
MPKYDIFVVCNACSDTHPIGTSVMLADGPAETQSIAAAYAGKNVPPDLFKLRMNRVQCPRTGRQYAQTNDQKEIFLVPTG